MLSHVMLAAVGTSGGAAETAAEPPAVPPGGREVDCALAEALCQSLAIQTSRSSRRRPSGSWGGGGLREVLNVLQVAERPMACGRTQACWTPLALETEREGEALAEAPPASC